MKKQAEQNVVLAAAWGFIVTGMVMITQQTVRADDAAPQEEPASRRQVRVEIRGSVPWLERIPFVKTFTAAAVQPAACAVKVTDAKTPEACQAACPATAADAAHPARLFAFVARPGDKAEGATECTDCPESRCCVRAGIAQVAGMPCVVREEIVVQQVAGQRATPCCATTATSEACANHHGCEQVMELKTEVANLRAELEACRQVMSERKEMVKELVNIMADKAGLEAKLQVVAVEQQARERLQELMAENAKLKSMMELTIHRQSIEKGSLEMAAENERLRTRLAELEEARPAATLRANRTAKKSETDDAAQAK